MTIAGIAHPVPVLAAGDAEIPGSGTGLVGLAERATLSGARIEHGLDGHGTSGSAPGSRGRDERARQQLDRLTDPEREVAIAVGHGRSNAEIGRELYMSVATVKAHVSHVLEKLELNTRVQIALLAHDAGEA